MDREENIKQGFISIIEKAIENYMKCSIKYTIEQDVKWAIKQEI